RHGHRHGRNRVHGRRPARPGHPARGRPGDRPGQRPPLGAAGGALGRAPARRRGRGARRLRPAAARAGTRRRHPRARGAPMSWRTTLTLLMLLGAIASGWSVWRLSRPAEEAVLATRPDYVLRDYEITVLDRQ